MKAVILSLGILTSMTVFAGGTGGGGVLANNLLSMHGGGISNLAVRFESESPDGIVRFTVLDKETMKTSDRMVDAGSLSPNELRILESSIETGSWVEL